VSGGAWPSSSAQEDESPQVDHIDAAPSARYPDRLRELVDTYLEKLDFAAADPRDAADAQGTDGLVDAMRHSLLAGGKRIRPVLSLELIHTYSLIHDDLPAMDDDDLRRGRPTCHVVYGEDTAILAGDALFAEAVRLVCERQDGGPAVKVRILAELSLATGVTGMVGGQYLDLQDAGRESPEALARVHALKTGRLMAAAVHCGLALNPPPAQVDTAYRAFARELGLLFQIVDDILDVAGTEEDLGKAVGADARRGKVTYASLHGLTGARALAEQTHARARSQLETIPGDVLELADITDLVYARDN
jgi:geranylgeranyl diphosphate synthase type II